ncbi:MAG TPA: LysM peptidoglycan-binding domain-containing protein [bacterium]
MLKKTLFYLAFAAFLSALPLFADSPKSSQTPTEYVVQNGDYLWKISKSVWGEGKKWLFLYAVNQDKIHDPGLIYAGEKLAIPSSITNELKQKAYKLVFGKGSEIPSVSHKASKETDSTINKESTSNTSEKASKSIPAETNLSEPTSVIGDKNIPPAPISGSNHTLLWIVLVAALILGVVVFKNMKKAEPSLQSPKPITQYPQTAQPTPLPSQPTGAHLSPGPSSVASANEEAERRGSPSAVSIADASADVYFRQGLYDKAANIYRGILEKDPYNAEVRKKLNDVENIMKSRAASTAPTQAVQTPSESKAYEPPMHSATITSASYPSSAPQTPPPNTPPTPPQEVENNPTLLFPRSHGEGGSDQQESNGQQVENKPQEDLQKPPDQGSQPS